jgi:hypothetical protein
MTVCIAAACKEGSDYALISCTDWQLSSALGSTETGLKQRTLNKGWRLLTSGNMADILAFLNIVRGRFNAAVEFDATSVIATIRAAANDRKRQKADELTIGRYGLSYDDFLKFGKEKLPIELFLDAMSSISDLPLGGEFIFAGFDGTLPVLVRLGSDFHVSLHEDFVTAGEGGYLAESSLLHRKHSDVHNIDQALYCVYEAKKYAERVRSVGEYTSLFVTRTDGTIRSVSTEGKTQLNTQFLTYGPKNLPTAFTIDKSKLYG